MKVPSIPTKLHSLLQSHGGLFVGAPVTYLDKDELSISVRTARAGNAATLWPEIGKRSKAALGIQGSGSGLDADAALIPALAEGLERYCAAVARSEQFTWATAEELGNDALDLDTIPRCSVNELAHPKCPLTLPDKCARIRWVRALSLLDGRIVYVPAVMVYSHIGIASPGERFWLAISTGCAAHSSYSRALLRAIYEVIERDAISITWLQKLRLPEIIVDHCSISLEPYWHRYRDGSTDVDLHFYNATLDFGAPTVYCLQIARHSKLKTTLVSCSTALSFDLAIAKTMADVAALGVAFRRPRNIPRDWDEFADIMHGAAYMARAEQAGAFEFLLGGGQQQKLSELSGNQGELDESAAFARIVASLEQRRFATYVVDLSTDEAIRSEMRVVRAIIPGLQPVSFRHRARYLGHPRLYDAPARMGYPGLREEDLNFWPQPFA